LLDRDLVIGVALVFARVLAGRGDLVGRRRLRVGCDPIDLRVGLGLHVRGLGFLHADVFSVAGEVVALFLGDVVGRVGVRHAGVLASLGRVLVGGVGLGLGDLFLALGVFHADVLRVAGQVAARRLVRLVLRFGVLVRSVVRILAHRCSGGADAAREREARGRE